MKFAHLSDTHLGYRQYGKVERERDFAAAFQNIIDKIIDLDVDFVIHSGDLFETPRPTTDALLVVQRAIKELNKAEIPIYAIAGNHDLSRRSNPIPPQVLFKNSGLNLISPIKPYYKIEDLFIGGVPYMPQSRNDILKEKMTKLSHKASSYKNKILILHQGIDKYIPQSELAIGDLPTNFSYYALGHLHNYINDSYGEGRLVYPGSTEIWKSNELADYKKNGKGFVLVDMEDGEVNTERISIDLPREFINENIQYETLNNNILKIKNYIKSLKLPPVVNLTITGSDFSGAEVYDYLNRELSDLTLLFRPTFNLMEKDVVDIGPVDDGPIDINKIISKKLEDEGEDIVNFAISLFDELSKDNLEEAEDTIETFYTKHYGGDEQ
ncbi:MAG: DNA repair exonuclease [Methanobrevibacter boviskoreani]|nr:DNA repair exonuclease [Methanobrevibacter boviskoreani]MCI6929716.1 DNA repair exonuclease [Methanobrevibacter boviskoreani]